MSDSNLIILSKDNFDETIKSNQVVVVDFWAEWCGPCKMFLPIMSELANDFEGKAVIAKVNVDENPDLAQQFGVMSIPNIIVFKDGEVVENITGVRPKPFIENLINKHLG